MKRGDTKMRMRAEEKLLQEVGENEAAGVGDETIAGKERPIGASREALDVELDDE